MELDVTSNRLIAGACDATITGPAPGSKTVNNMFKSHLESQRATITQAIEIMMKVVKLAYALNRPLLATD